MARTGGVIVDQTLLRMGFETPVLPNQFVKRVGTSQVMVTIMKDEAKILVNAKCDTEGFMLSQAFTRRNSWNDIAASMNKALNLLCK
jgi:hypothetical protein